jgi:hypothetical protein
MRLAIPLAIVALTAAMLAGCGGSSPTDESSQSGSTGPSESTAPSSPKAPAGATAKGCATDAPGAEGLRATGVSCGQARRVMLGWQRDPACAAPAGASRTSCTARSYRCLGARTDRGLAVSCSRAGASIAFLARRG